MTLWLCPKAVFDGHDLHRNMAVGVTDGVVTDLAARADLPARAKIETRDQIIGPGLFDTQVNGGGGVMLNNDPTPAGVRAIALAHRRAGTSFTLPTVITDRFEVTHAAAHAVLAEQGKNGVLGLHIEGPHISLAHKGTHNPALICPFDDQMMDLVTELRAAGLPVLLTLAPETVASGIIATLSQLGVIVSGGHSAATATQTEAALVEGLRSFTHLFNAMSPMSSRAPGMVGAAINSDAWCGFIADGHHVDHRMLALAIRARPVPARMVLVSDAMSTVEGPDQFELYGETIRVSEGRLINAQGSLAGAHIDLATSVARAVRMIGLPLAEALAMATTNPRAMMRLPAPQLLGSTVQELCYLPATLLDLAPPA